ncbi:hexuronate transporter [Neptunitalea sp. Y10]|uniref:Hexuronate transporter n=2 Tax=Neptunitalea lumnitzerae TaxID=2965509 RepID=A0ABQ5MF68_9FLAO|nr:hexuronate transporter [Neptunitalea sp. Y10]
MDRQVLSLTWANNIAPEFHWTNNDYGNVTALFSIFYAISMLIAGPLIDWLGTKKGFLWAIGIWSLGACLHAFSGIFTAGYITGEWVFSFSGAKEIIEGIGEVGTVVSISVTFFIFSRLVLAFGEAGNFPAAIKTTAEYFPKKDRALATSIFNAGATVGALGAPLTIPFIANAYGWEMAFILIGALGFIWMGVWIFVYDKPETHKRVSKDELAYIQQDNDMDEPTADGKKRGVNILKCFNHKQTWVFLVGKFMTDGVWWFFLFWTPAYLSAIYDMNDTETALPLFILYAITLLAIIGGWLPSYFVNKGKEPYDARMKSMFIFALFPLLTLFAQPLGQITYWIPIVIIGIAGAAHQSWSANIFSVVGDLFPRRAIATITGIGGLAGGIGSFFINKGSGMLFDYSKNTQMTFLGFKGEEAGYFIIFCVCAVAYMIAWVVMKSLLPKYEPVTDL